MTDWILALRVFAFGLSGVFITLALLMAAITAAGFIIAKLSKGREGK